MTDCVKMQLLLPAPSLIVRLSSLSPRAQAAADAEWCPAAVACDESCEKAVKLTYEACETAWGDLLGCLGVSEEEFVAELEEEADCPGLCDEDGFAIAAN